MSYIVVEQPFMLAPFAWHASEADIIAYAVNEFNFSYEWVSATEALEYYGYPEFLPEHLREVDFVNEKLLKVSCLSVSFDFYTKERAISRFKAAQRVISNHVKNAYFLSIEEAKNFVNMGTKNSALQQLVQSELEQLKKENAKKERTLMIERECLKSPPMSQQLAIA